MRILTTLTLALVFLLTSCGEEKRRGIDYDKAKAELSLDESQEKQFDAVVEKYKKVGEANREANKTQGGKMDRVAMFAKMDEMRKQQSAEMAAFLSPEQLKKYDDYVAKNSRKRPGYSDELMAKLKTELALDEKQAQMLDAVNKTFEKSYHDAHDFYHGNSELAMEYWNKYDAERKKALAQVFTPEQNAKYLELVKEEGKPVKRE